MEELIREVLPYVISVLSALAIYIKVKTDREKTAKSRNDAHDSNVVRLEKMEWRMDKVEEDVKNVQAYQDDISLKLEAMNETLISIKTTMDIFVKRQLEKGVK